MVSIIIPVYNNEDTIRRTLKSVASQSYKDFEVIVVNDGSSDGSADIIRKFADRDPRFAYIEQENGGVSAARNRGLKEASKKYIMFVDADDVLPPDALKHMHQIAVTNDADTIMGIMNKVDGTWDHVLRHSSRLTKKCLQIRKDDPDIIHSWSLCNKWLSREIIEKNGLEFEHHRHLEDAVFLYSYLRYAEKIFSCPFVVYSYIKPLPALGRTTTQNIDAGLLESALNAFRRLEEITAGYGDDFHGELVGRFLRASLISDYYRRIWRTDRKTADILTDQINSFYAGLDEERQGPVRRSGFDIIGEDNRIKSRDELMLHPMVDVALTDKVSPDRLRDIIDGLYDQFEPAFRLIAEKSVMEAAGCGSLKADNMALTEKGGVMAELRSSEAPYFMIIDSDMLPNHLSIYTMLKIMEKDEAVQIVSTAVDIYDGKTVSRADQRPEDSFSNKLIRKTESTLEAVEKGTGASEMLGLFEHELTDDSPVIACVAAEGPSGTGEPAKPAKNVSSARKLLRKIRKTISGQSRPEKTQAKKEEEKKPETKQDKKISAMDCYLNLDIKKNTVVVEGLGKRPKGSSLYLLRELTSGRYGDMEIIYPVRKETKELTEAIFEREGFSGIRLVESGSDEYKKALFSSEFLFNEVDFPLWWIKKPGQTYVNLWHGTPIKKLGKKKPGRIHRDAAAAHDFTSADYMLMPSDYCIEHILKDMDVLEISCAKALMLGYPRTGALFDDSMRERVRQRYGPDDRKVCAWMPTWSDDQTSEDILGFLKEMDAGMDDEMILYVNLHHRTKIDVDCQSFAHIRSFPEELDIYEFLTAADVLITDYSSVLFDFAATRRKIILHCPDRERYKETRGLYMEPEELPFPVTSDTAALLKEMRSPKEYDDSTFIDTFNRYDHADNARRLCDAVILGKTDVVEVRELPSNDDAVFFCCDSFRDGAVTEYLLGVCESGKWPENVWLSFREDIAEENIDRIEPMLRSVRIFANRGREGRAMCERKRLYGDMKLKRFVLADPESSKRIVSFAWFDEPVRMLLTERQMDMLRQGDENMTKAVSRFSRFGDGIFTLSEEDSRWLSQNMDADAGTIRSADDFYKAFFTD